MAVGVVVSVVQIDDDVVRVIHIGDVVSVVQIDDVIDGNDGSGDVVDDGRC